ncbi:MAG: hypothetical protein K1X78_09155 [Verrucomicrobiaceae bacterium]|nr:hypothetical protein [Verrucomicrobiaceae bacterium]
MKLPRHPIVAAGVALCLALIQTRAGVPEDMALLRQRCLFYAAGRAPNDPGTISIRHGLYAQSPFSPTGEIDLAASGLSLAALPAAVATSVITLSQGTAIALDASARIKEMITKSAQAVTPAARALYGYKGMLFHYYVWDGVAGEFHGSAEVSSIDTALLMYGLAACAQYFGGTVLTDYTSARDLVDWKGWLDTSTPGHLNQFRMAWYPASGFAGWWDWWSQETLLLDVMACASDITLDPRALWTAWRRDLVTYVPPGPAAQTFVCHATWNGDPFTVFYASALLGLHRCPADFNGVNWFAESRTSYQGHVEYFRKERGFLDSLTFAFFNGSTGSIAKPRSSPDAPAANYSDATIYSVAGGLPYYSSTPAANPLAVALSQLMATTPGFFQWHGWPLESVMATQSPHLAASGFIIGQDISLTALAVDNLLAGGRVHDLLFADARIAGALSMIFPPQLNAVTISSGLVQANWSGVPLSAARLQRSADLVVWQDAGPVSFSAAGVASWSGTPSGVREFLRLSIQR